MLLSDRDLQAQLDAGRLGLDPFDPAMLQPSSIDVRLDRFFRVFDNSRYTHIDPQEQQDDLTSLVEPEGDAPFVLHPGEFVLGSTFEQVTLPDDLAGRLEGKALAIDTPIPTPEGWRTMGGLEVGDHVFGADGRPCPVVAATEVMYRRRCREVVFSDGHAIVADQSHQWRTWTKSARKHDQPALVRTTADIEGSLRAGHEYNHHVPLAAAVRYPERDLPIDPYTLGVWLGDGTRRSAVVTCGAGDGLSADGSLGSQLRAVRLLGDKHVPEIYLQSCVGQRLALLQGLMDSDGHVDAFGRCEFVSIRETLSDAVVELAASLGLRPTKRKKAATFRGVDHGVAFQVRFTPHIQVFRLQRKVMRLKTARFHAFRAIVDVRKVASRPVRCIQVGAPNGLFLVGPTFIPTHNSSLGRLGLLTHSTAGFIDPGFSGHITLELSNVANLPITLWPGMKIGQLCLFQLSSPAEHPYGSARAGSKYQNQRGPTPSRAYRNFHRADTRR